MSFVRPELVERLRPWREAGVWAGAAAFGLFLLVQGIAGGGLLPAALGLLLLCAGGGLLAAALRRRRVQGQAPDEGVVQVAEARIGYFGPRAGGFVDLGSLTRIDIVTDGSRASWWLQEEGGASVRVPVGARGAERVYDALAATFQLDEEALKDALATRRPARFPIWVRSEHPARARLP